LRFVRPERRRISRGATALGDAPATLAEDDASTAV
jgi:hypothetical protein